jgi:hypothetical protein
MSLDKLADMRKLKSLQLTMAFVNEISEIQHKVLIDTIISRLGRYPADDYGGPSWIGMFSDTNMPDDDSWLYRYAELGAWRTESSLLHKNGTIDEEDLRIQLALALGDSGKDEKNVQSILEGLRQTTLQGDPEKLRMWEFFKQPPALVRRADRKGYLPHPDCENWQHQPKGRNYWQDLVAGHDEDWIKVYLLAEYGSLFTGRAVYEGIWSPTRHIAREPMEAIPSLPLYLGFDWGLTPSCVIAQLLPNGQLRVLAEFTSEKSGAKQFLEEQVVPGIRIMFSACRVGGGWGDPSGLVGGQADITQNCFRMCDQFFGQGVILPVGNNRFPPRRESVINRLRLNVGAEPAFLVNSSCKVIIKGFNGGYQFNRVRSMDGSADVYRDEPSKNHPVSDASESVQYLSLGLDGASILESRMKQQLNVASVDAATQWAGYV